MEIIWLGHSCFRLKGKEATLVTDPYNESLGYSLGKPMANVVTVSHPHPGHNNTDGVGNSPKVISIPGEYEIADIFIIGVSTFHDSEQGRRRGKNTIYLIGMDEIKLCHLGDLGHVLSPQQVEELGNVEVLLIPVGSISTLDAKAASEVVRLLSPRIIVPMHYNTAITPWLEPVDRFLKESGLREVTPQTKLSVTRSNLPSETQVVLLDYPH
jgi:L-ascorbate metabolism protein UlaG (beta-lactamase superfamily)